MTTVKRKPFSLNLRPSIVNVVTGNTKCHLSFTTIGFHDTCVILLWQWLMKMNLIVDVWSRKLRILTFGNAWIYTQSHSSHLGPKYAICKPLWQHVHWKQTGSLLNYYLDKISKKCKQAFRVHVAVRKWNERVDFVLVKESHKTKRFLFERVSAVVTTVQKFFIPDTSF